MNVTFRYDGVSKIFADYVDLPPGYVDFGATFGDVIQEDFAGGTGTMFIDNVVCPPELLNDFPTIWTQFVYFVPDHNDPDPVSWLQTFDTGVAFPPPDVVAAPTHGPWEFPDIHDDRELRTPEWRPLVKTGSGEDGILQIEWDPISDEIRVTGPVVYDNPPHAPAP